MFYCTIRNKAAVLRALKLCVGHELHLLRLLVKYRHMGQILEGDVFLRLYVLRCYTGDEKKPSWDIL